jgi:hypothetical protein
MPAPSEYGTRLDALPQLSLLQARLLVGDVPQATSEMGQTRKSDDAITTSALPPTADTPESGCDVRKVPIVLKKSFLGDEQNFLGPLMRLASGDVRDHIVSHKNDHGPSYRRYGA